ncbi:MAG: leucine-rich repeat protein [Lachnospiraceae bacterium]|nr:leucine-rich repeat protein [Lachnospiraceae bacterium]
MCNFRIKTIIFVVFLALSFVVNGIFNPYTYADEFTDSSSISSDIMPEDTAENVSTDFVTENSAISTNGNEIEPCVGEIINSGECGAQGDNLTWVLYDDGRLVISGQGKMKEYLGIANNISTDISKAAPWYFDRPKIKTIIIESGVTNILSGAFSHCTNLEEFHIPDTVTEIDNDIFYNCRNLSRIIVSDNNPKFDSRNNCNAIIETDSNTLYKGCKGTVIPSDIKTIGLNAFYDCKNLNEIVIPNGVEVIGGAAFLESGITSITVPNSIRLIENSSFSECNKLKAFVIPDNVEKIGTAAFENCDSLNSIIIPSGVKEIGSSVFSSCDNLTSVVIKSSPEKIPYGLFQWCKSLTNFSIPDSVTVIDEFAFCGCSSLSSIVIPDNVIEIREAAFCGCSKLEGIVLPDNLKKIGNRAFSGTSLERLYVPKNVEKLGTNIIINCQKIKKIEVDENNEVYDSRKNCNAIIETDINRMIVACSSTVIPDSVTVIGGWDRVGIISDYDNLSSVVIPVTLKKILQYSFCDCKCLTDVYYEGTEEDKQNLEIDNIYGSNKYICSAHWHYNYLSDETIIKHTVSFNTNGGTPISDKRVIDGKSLAKPSSPEKDNYSFIGWYDESLENAYDFSTPVTSDITLYAKWEWNENAIVSKTINISGTNVNILWGLDHFKKNSSTYNNNLAYAGLLLSEKIEQSYSDSEDALKDLGFTDIKHSFYTGLDTPGLSIGSKEVVFNGKNKVIIAVVSRGTSNIFDVKTDVFSVFNGFLNAGNYSYNQLSEYISDLYSDYDKKDIILFVTGHSLGGAVAGQVARKTYINGYDRKQTFVYTYASPNYDTQDGQNIKEGDEKGKYTNVFNIIHERDAIPTVPWGYKRVGTDITYGNLDFSFWEKLDTLKHHVTETYLRCLMEGDKLSAQRDGKYVSIHCPVDIVVMRKSDNTEIARTEGNSVTYSGDGDVLVLTDGEEKYIYSVSNTEYIIQFTGTGIGNMDYAVNSYDISSGETISEKEYNDIVLYDGKSFKCQINDLSDVSNLELFVTDSAGNPVKEVKTDGTENDISGGGEPTPSPVNPDPAPTPSDPDEPEDGEEDIKPTLLTGTGIVIKEKIDVTSYFGKSYGKYTVAPKGYASITNKGILTAKKSGDVTVTGYTKSDKKWVADTENTVKIHIEKPAFTKKTITATKPGAVIDGAGNIKDSTIAPTSWMVSNTKVATINKDNGLIKTVGKGAARITAVYGTGKQAAKYSFTVKVVPPVINKKKATLLTGATLKLKLNNTKLTPEWSSSDLDKAVVDSTGKVTTLTAGTAKITGSVEKVGYSCEITVKPPAIKKKSLTVKVNKKVKVGLKNTKLKNTVWKSSDEKIATVDSSGNVTGISAGTAIISTSTGGVTNECTVTVR